MRHPTLDQVTLLVLTALALAPPSPLAAQVCDAARIHAIIDEFQSRQQNVGIAAAVMAAGEVAFADAWGWADREAGVPATTETLFGVASITKGVTGLALLKLAESGALDPDAEIQRYVPAFPRHPDGPVTLRRLAAHLGGIRHWGPERNKDLYARRFEDVRDVLSLFRDDPFRIAPDTRYAYSSYGYDLIGMAIQVASGRSYQEYVRQAVLDPLGLDSFAFDHPGYGGRLRAARYSWYDLEEFDEVDVPVRVPDWDYTHNMAGGNMVANVVDVARLGSAVTRPGFLSENSYEELWTRPRIARVESSMSFGWFVREGGDRLAINGSNAGLQSGVAVWRSRELSVAVVANSWGIGSRSAELMDDGADGLLGKLTAACGGP